MNLKNRFTVETKMLSFLTIGIITLVILCVWISGIHSHRTLFQNSIISTSILAGAFFLFVSLGLYFGLKLKENVGAIVNREKLKSIADKRPKFEGFDGGLPDIGDGDGCAGVILSVVLWFFIGLVAVFLLYFLGIFIWATVLILIAMLYWIFFRALRLVFKNSKHCKDDLVKSFGFGIFYSFLYISWIYGIIFLLHFLQHSEKVTF
ncbi:hypothetical protein [Chryseobacterium sp. Leaf394]|uniref:hypothetical protein n=1 Tax=Chryseobacterium sp. Leaf394 TaxID=1736361 RepID=UPI0006FAB040|nr:hypothetical protein [Chryseobacterium sp. Leaf394]KQS92644.1 hypothetical protein ASG21_09460 [Chryseobacterium sp. Leaf394]